MSSALIRSVIVLGHLDAAATAEVTVCSLLGGAAVSDAPSPPLPKLPASCALQGGTAAFLFEAHVTGIASCAVVSMTPPREPHSGFSPMLAALREWSSSPGALGPAPAAFAACLPADAAEYAARVRKAVRTVSGSVGTAWAGVMYM